MIIFITLLTMLQTIAISLGVGSSTLAIVNFFVAIADGTIDETERRMMGIVYVVLRIAMVAILATTILLIAIEYRNYGLVNLSGFSWAELFTLIAIFVNAMLMTAHLVPSTVGPAVQAGSWYTVGALVALQILGMTNFHFWQFFMAYITWIILAIGIVNGIMAIIKEKRLARN